MVGSLNCEPLRKTGRVNQMMISRWQVEDFHEVLLVSVLRWGGVGSVVSPQY